MGKASGRRALCTAGALALVLVTAPAEVAAELVLDGMILDRPNRYDGYPTHLFIDGVHHIWFCGQSSITGADAVFHSANSSGLDDSTGWSSPSEVLNHLGVPWATNHVCDPSVITGAFVYNSETYRFALYFTADVSGVGSLGDAAVGVAFSNDGIGWTAHPDLIIEPDGGFDGSYGAGAGASAWSRSPGTVHHVYRDSTTITGNVEVRADGLNEVLFTGQAPSLSQDFNTVKLMYDAIENSVSAFMNGTLLLDGLALDGVGYTPVIRYAGFQFHEPSIGGATRLDDFSINGPVGLIFQDGFESGDLGAWSSVSE